jgi:hypothetical protein
MKTEKNAFLMARYIRSGLSEKGCAAEFAKLNKSLPRNERFGPYGTTNAETLAKQIRREKKRMKKDDHYRHVVEYLVTAMGPTDIS